ncbi:MAG: hypothetical protein K2X08_02935 [Chlamydiales bacterium]|nr:hypothetical protein [Chlamydiales bacterium]
MEKDALNQAASHILSAALFETFPMVDLWLAETTDVGFVCECFFPHPVHADTLPLLEQKMKQIVQEARFIRLLEMVPVSAAALLQKEGHVEQVELLKDFKGRAGTLVELIEMGSFHQLTQGFPLNSTAELKAFKIISLKTLPNQGLRVEGIAASSKEELKVFLKKLSNFKENNYCSIGEKMGFWIYKDDGMIWLEKGIEARQKIQNLFFQERPLIEWRGTFEKIIPNVKKNCRILHCEPAIDLRSSLFAVQGLEFFKPEEFVRVLNSSLHLVHKTLIMLGFDCWVKVLGKSRTWRGLELPSGVKVEEEVQAVEARIDWMVEDSLERPVQVITLKKPQRVSEKREVLICEAFIERILVLMLEKNLRTLFLVKNLNRKADFEN